ncbi:hypothetical protein TNCV_1033721 [Trichonephila clavipes]|nr:hypothetical protein TNCV_1033721 [Trichonephila clavipes]
MDTGTLYHPRENYIASREQSFHYRMDLITAKISLYFFLEILPFIVTIGLAERHDAAAHIMTDRPTCLTTRRKYSRPYACADVLQTCTHPVIGKSVKDDWSDGITFFHLLIYQVL